MQRFGQHTNEKRILRAWRICTQSYWNAQNPILLMCVTRKKQGHENINFTYTSYRIDISCSGHCLSLKAFLQGHSILCVCVCARQKEAMSLSENRDRKSDILQRYINKNVNMPQRGKKGENGTANLSPFSHLLVSSLNILYGKNWIENNYGVELNCIVISKWIGL